MKGCRILGCKRAHTRSHSKIRAATTEILEEPEPENEGRAAHVPYSQVF